MTHIVNAENKKQTTSTTPRRSNSAMSNRRTSGIPVWDDSRITTPQSLPTGRHHYRSFRTPSPVEFRAPSPVQYRPSSASSRRRLESCIEPVSRIPILDTNSRNSSPHSGGRRRPQSLILEPSWANSRIPTPSNIPSIPARRRVSLTPYSPCRSPSPLSFASSCSSRSPSPGSDNGSTWSGHSPYDHGNRRQSLPYRPSSASPRSPSFPPIQGPDSRRRSSISPTPPSPSPLVLKKRRDTPSPLPPLPAGRRREPVEVTPPKSKWPETALPRSVPGTPPEELGLEFTPPDCDEEPQPMIEEDEQEPRITEQLQSESEPSQRDPVAVVDQPPSPPQRLPSIKITPTAVSPAPSRPESPTDEEVDEDDPDDLVDPFSDEFAEKLKDEDFMERLPSVTEEAEEDEEECVETGQTTEESRPVVATDQAAVTQSLSLNSESDVDISGSEERDDKAIEGTEGSETVRKSAQDSMPTPEPVSELVVTTTLVPNLETASPTNEFEDRLEAEGIAIEEVLKPEFPIEAAPEPVESGEIGLEIPAPSRAVEDEPTVEQTLNASEGHPTQYPNQKLEPLPETPSAMATGPSKQREPVALVSIPQLSTSEAAPSIDELNATINMEKVEFQSVQSPEAEGSRDLGTDDLVEEEGLDGPGITVDEIPSRPETQSPIRRIPDETEAAQAAPPTEDIHDESHGAADTEIPSLQGPLAPSPSFSATELDTALNKLNGEGPKMGRSISITSSGTESPPHRPILTLMSSPPPKPVSAFPNGDEPAPFDSEPSSRSSSSSSGRPWKPVRRRSTPDPTARWNPSSPSDNVPKLILESPTPRNTYNPSEALQKFWDHNIAVAAAEAEGRDPPPPPSPPRRIRRKDSDLESECEKYVMRRGLRGRSLSAPGGKDLTFEEQENIREEKAAQKAQQEKEAMSPQISEAKASVNKAEDMPERQGLTEGEQTVDDNENVAAEDLRTAGHEDTEADIPIEIQEETEADISSAYQKETAAETILSLPPPIEVKHKEAELETAAALNPQDSEQGDTTPLITPEPIVPSRPAPSSSSSTTFSWKTPLLLTVCAIIGLLLTLPSLSSHTLRSLTATDATITTTPSASIGTLDKMRASITSVRESVCSVAAFMPETVGFSIMAPTRVEVGAPTLTMTAAAAMEEGRSSW